MRSHIGTFCSCCNMDSSTQKQGNIASNEISASQRMMQWFIQSIRCAMNKYGLVDNNIDFINLSSMYWISAEEFFSLNDIPNIYKHNSEFECDDYSCTWQIPKDFAIVFKNGSLLVYCDCVDPSKSDWCLIRCVKKSPLYFLD